MERGIIQKTSHPKACGEHSTLPPSPKGQGHEPWPGLCTYALRPPDVTCSLGGQFLSTAVTSHPEPFPPGLCACDCAPAVTACSAHLCGRLEALGAAVPRSNQPLVGWGGPSVGQFPGVCERFREGLLLGLCYLHFREEGAQA